MVSVKAAATGKVSWGPIVSGLGPLEHPVENTHSKNLHLDFIYSHGFVSYMLKHKAGGKCTEDRRAKTNRSKLKLNQSRNSRRVSRTRGGLSSHILAQ